MSETLKIEAYTDADWAGQPDRHSITGGLLLLDSVNVSSWARTQKAIATSSGESELYAMSAGAAEALGLRELHTDIGLPATTTPQRQHSSHGRGDAPRTWPYEARASARSCSTAVDRRRPLDPYRRLPALQTLQTFSRSTCRRMCSSLSSRNSAFYSNYEATGLLNECYIFVTIGMLSAERRVQCKARPECFEAYRRVCSRHDSASEVHVQASTEACQTFE